MSYDVETLYRLMPAMYRVQDAQQNYLLRALLSVIAEQVEVVENDIEQLYDDLFIETCAQWVVPYIGDLIGYRALAQTPHAAGSRAEVANTIGYRRRKGTAYVLGLLTHDVTAWPARVVECFQLLGTTQYMKHLRPGNLRTPDLRSWKIAEEIGSAFDAPSRTVDVRRIASGRGRYNIPNIGIFAWRLAPYPVTAGTPRHIAPQTYTFDPLGADIRLHNPATQGEAVAQIAEPVNLPVPLGRRALYYEWEARRQAAASSKTPPAPVFFASPPFQITVNGTVIPPDRIQICNLSTWILPAAVKQYKVDPNSPTSSTVAMPIDVAVDPELGRFALSSVAAAPGDVRVNYAYAFSGNYGASEYARPNLPAATHKAGRVAGTIAAALAAQGTANGVVQIEDSATYSGDVTITLAGSQHLTLQAADRKRPVIDGRILIHAAPEAALTLDGLEIGNGVQITGVGPVAVTIAHCTVVAGGIQWQAGGGGNLVLDHSLSGPLTADDGVSISIAGSAIDAGKLDALAISAGDVTILRTTVIGRTEAREAGLIENSILTGRLVCQRSQSGCIRFTFLPFDSQSPRRFECRPAALDEAWMAPVFTSLDRTQGAYLQLHKACPAEIRTGAEDGSEMGIFHDLFQPQREANLKMRLAEYLRLGLETGIIYAN